MGFFDKIKGWLNIGGIKVQLQGVPSSLSKVEGKAAGSIVLTTKSDKHVLKLTAELVEEKTTGRGDDKKTKKQTLGQWVKDGAFDIKTDATETYEFEFDYQIPQGLKDAGGALGAVGKLGAFASAEKIEYYIVAECDVKGTAMDPSARSKVVLA